MPSKSVSFKGDPSTWDFTELLDIYNPEHDWKRTCVGFAPSQGRRCWNPYNAGNRAAADRILLLLPTLTSHPKELKSKLYDLAGCCLCLRYHQNQAVGVAADWFDFIMDCIAKAAPSSPKKVVKAEPSSPKAFIFRAPAPVTPVRKLRTPASFDSGYFGSAAASSTSLVSGHSTPPTEENRPFSFTFTPASPCEGKGKGRQAPEASSPPASPSPAPRVLPPEIPDTTATAEAAQSVKEKLAAVAQETALRKIEEARRHREAELQRQKAADEAASAAAAAAAAAAAQRLAAVKATSSLREQRWTAVAQNAVVKPEEVIRVKEEETADEPAENHELPTLAIVSKAMKERIAASTAYRLSEFMLLGGVGAAGAVVGFGVCYALGLARRPARKR